MKRRDGMGWFVAGALAAAMAFAGFTFNRSDGTFAAVQYSDLSGAQTRSIVPNFYANGTTGAGTYTTPTDSNGRLPTYLDIWLTGGGAGGNPGCTLSTGGGAGGTTWFDSISILAVAGGSGGANQMLGGQGGNTDAITSPITDGFITPGGDGGTSTLWAFSSGLTTTQFAADMNGGVGGSSWWGGGGWGGVGSTTAGGNGSAYGSGGGGGGCTNSSTSSFSVNGGGGGGAGGTVHAFYANPASASYSLNIGAAGTAGASSTSATDDGGTGQVGIIQIWAYW